MTIVCDHCGGKQSFPMPPFEAMKAHGWLEHNDEWLCPDCTPSGAESRIRKYGAGRFGAEA